METDANTGTETARPYAPTALPSVTARLLAFVAILIAGLCGGMIGWAVTDLQCGGGETRILIDTSKPNPTAQVLEPEDDGVEDDCTAWNGAGALVGAVGGAGGTAIVSVLVLRAMAEWRRDLDVDESPDTIRPRTRPSQN